MAEPVKQRRARGRPRNLPDEGTAGTVQALDRGLNLMRRLANHGRATLTELAQATEMPASSAHRLLMTLSQHDMVEFEEETQDWMIGVEAFRVGSAFAQRSSLVEASRETMRSVVEEIGETANLGIAEAGDVVFLSQVESNHPIRAFFRPGARGPMHSSGIGKALLAEYDTATVDRIITRKGLPEFTPNTLTTPERLAQDLEETHRRGWAFDDEERFMGMRCIASAIFNSYGEAIGGLSVSGPTQRIPDTEVEAIGRKLKAAANTLTDKIGGRVPDQE